MLRDRTEGTHHHRIGGEGNELVAQMNTLPHDYSAGGILAIIEYYSQIFDNLAKEWSPNYKAKTGSIVRLGQTSAGLYFLSGEPDP